MLIAATSPLLVVALLACPVGMGLMMFFMGRGMRGMKQGQGQSDSGDRSLADLKAEQARLAEKVESLEERQPTSAEHERERV
jgi:hypothetical protein